MVVYWQLSLLHMHKYLINNAVLQWAFLWGLKL